MFRYHKAFHPELRRIAPLLPSGVVGPRTLRPVRALVDLALRGGGAEVRHLPSGGSVRIYRSVDATADVPGLVWIHGGGYLIGKAQQDDALCRLLSRELGAVVVSVDYRLAPEHPYPAPLDDCHEAFALLRDLDGVDTSRIAIGGASAGGGLAAQLAIRIRDRGEPTPALQLLVYPMLDDRSQHTSVDAAHLRIWNGKANQFGWRSYLGDADPAIVAPARIQDLGGLAPAWIGVGTLDLFYDEDLAYAERLRAAGVECALDVVPGAFHAFDMAAARSAVAKDFLAAQVNALRTAFAD